MGSQASVKNDVEEVYEIRAYNDTDVLNWTSTSTKFIEIGQTLKFVNNIGKSIRFFFKPKDKIDWKWCDVENGLCINISDLEKFESTFLTKKIYDILNKEKGKVQLERKWIKIDEKDVTFKNKITDGGQSIIYEGVYQGETIIIKKIVPESKESFDTEKKLFE